MNARQHRTAFVDELVGTLPVNFRGVLDITSSAPFVVSAVRSLVNERGDFLVSTYPVADLTRTTPAPIFFPQIAAGGGYATLFILLSSGGAAAAVLDFLSDTGSPLPVGK